MDRDLLREEKGGEGEKKAETGNTAGEGEGSGWRRKVRGREVSSISRSEPPSLC